MRVRRPLWPFFFVFIPSAAGTLTLVLPDVFLHVRTNVTLTWIREPQDPDQFMLQTSPPSPILSNPVVLTNDALTGTANVVFGVIGPYILQATDQFHNVLASSNPFTALEPPVFNSSTIISLIPTKPVTSSQSGPTMTFTTTPTTDTPTSTSPPPVTAAATGVNVKAIVIGCVLGVIILLLICVLIFFWRKRRKDKELRRFTFHQDMMIRPDNDSNTIPTPFIITPTAPQSAPPILPAPVTAGRPTGPSSLVINAPPARGASLRTLRLSASSSAPFSDYAPSSASPAVSAGRRAMRKLPVPPATHDPTGRVIPPSRQPQMSQGLNGSPATYGFSPSATLSPNRYRPLHRDDDRYYRPPDNSTRRPGEIHPSGPRRPSDMQQQSPGVSRRPSDTQQSPSLSRRPTDTQNSPSVYRRPSEPRQTSVSRRPSEAQLSPGEHPSEVQQSPKTPRRLPEIQGLNIPKRSPVTQSIPTPIDENSETPPYFIQRPQPPRLRTRLSTAPSSPGTEPFSAASAMSSSSAEIRIKMKEGIQRMRAQRESLAHLQNNKPMPPIPLER